jgi:hypothetical protein
MKCFTFVKTRTVGIFVTVFVREQNFRFVFIALNNYSFTSGFWPRVRARALRAPVFLGALPRQTGRCAPPDHRSFAASYSSAKKYKFTISRN